MATGGLITPTAEYKVWWADAYRRPNTTVRTGLTTCVRSTRSCRKIRPRGKSVGYASEGSEMIFILGLALVASILLGIGSIWVFPKWSVSARVGASAGAFLLAAAALLVTWVVAAHLDRGGRPVTQEELRRAAETTTAEKIEPSAEQDNTQSED